MWEYFSIPLQASALTGIVWDCKGLQSQFLDYNPNDKDCWQNMQTNLRAHRGFFSALRPLWGAAEGHVFSSEMSMYILPTILVIGMVIQELGL